MNTNLEDFKCLPAVDKLLSLQEVRLLISSYGKELVLFSIRNSLDFFRLEISHNKRPPTHFEIVEKIHLLTKLFGNKSLKKVFNATGIIIHTNLGRAPYGQNLLNDSFQVLEGYNNLEFNLQSGDRGNRNDHVSEIIKFLTGAEDVLVVNNAAAAVMLILRTFAKNKEVIVSRGELVEIGGSFRVPEIMAASDCKMVEVGTTNKTNIEDYKKAIAENTAILFKAHKSNYIIKGFTQEPKLEELAELGKQFMIPVVYDLGSGLLRKIENPIFKNEPNVRQTIEKGIDMVCFSGDKLLGGPQAGIIVGRKVFIDKLKKEPMLRALRVCKATLAFLESACSYYLYDNILSEKNHIFKIFNRKPDELIQTAGKLQKYLNIKNIETEIVSSRGQCGGGSLPDTEIESFSVMIKNNFSNKLRSEYAEKMHNSLLLHEKPILGILKKGNIYFDVLTIFDDEVEEIAKVICEVNENITKESKI